MCGIVAAVARDPAVTQMFAPAVERILDAMAYRGPDARGIWADRRVVLGHRRLSIIDLSDAGAQPMHDGANGLHITFNGEIYNYQELRRDLERQGYRFHSRTDTEVILGAYHVYGRNFLAKMRGMFAFVLFDEKNGKVLLCRDRMGKKPLFYYFDGRQLLACSELKGLYAFQGISLSPDPAGIGAFFSLQYVPGTGTILKEVKRIAPGECLELDLRSWRATSFLYWSVYDHIGCHAGPAVKIDEIDAAIRESVRYRLIADVEVGILLSGGIDSSLLSCYAAGLSTSPLKAFLVSFGQKDLDESVYARIVARSLNLELVEIDGGRLDADTFRRVMYHAGEPLGDPACIPTFMISEVIGRHVKVVLSGEGADELFWGYDYYRKQLLYDRLAPFLPRLRPGQKLGGLLAALESNPRVRGPVARLCKVLSSPCDTGCSRWTTVFGAAALGLLLPAAPAGIARCSGLMESALAALKRRAPASEAALALDLMYWLPDDLLVKVDRMSMAHSIEARAPYLDHRLVELALRMPAAQKIDSGSGKKVLRELLLRKLPQDAGRVIAARKKHGFDVPLVSWLGGELRGLADDCFSESGLRDADMLNANYVQRLWRDFKTHGGNPPFARKLWLVLCFLTWYGNHKNKFGFR